MSIEDKLEKTEIKDSDANKTELNGPEARLAELEKIMKASGFWDDKEKAQKDALEYEQLKQYRDALTALERLQQLQTESRASNLIIEAGITSLGMGVLEIIGYTLASLLPISESLRERLTRGRASKSEWEQFMVEWQKSSVLKDVLRDHEGLRKSLTTTYEVLEKRRETKGY